MKKGRQGEGGGPKRGFKQPASHRNKIKKAQFGKKNSNFKHGGRVDYRSKVGAKADEIVHHRDSNRMNNSPSNLQRLKGRKPGATTNSLHEKKTRRGAGRKRGS